MKYFTMRNLLIYILFINYFQIISEGEATYSEIRNNLISEIRNISLLQTVIQTVMQIIPEQLEKTGNEICDEHLQLFRDSLQNMEPWALQMLDSSTKIPDGILEGHIVHMGNFDECVNVDVPDGEFSGQHCVAMISKYSNSTDGPVLRFLNIQWSTCIPSSCSSEDWETLLETAFLMYNTSIQITVDENSCQTKHSNDQLYTGDWMFIAFAALLVVLVVLSTGYDVFQKNSGSRKTLYLSFSFYTNGKKLLATSSSQDCLQCLHGIRFLTMAWIFLDHQHMIYCLYSPLVNLVDVLDLFSEWYRMYLLNGTLSVDTFFLLSGLLVSYIFFTRMKDKSLSSFSIPLFYLHRFIRLTPLLAFLIFFQVTLLRVFGSGPFQRIQYEEDTEPCRKYWWSVLLYIQNYVNPNEACLGHTWFLCVDTQLYLLSPLLLILLSKKPKIGISILSLLIAGGVILDFIIAYMNKLSLNLLDGVSNKHLKYLYSTHTRFPPWIVGIILGYILHRKKRKSENLNKIEVTCGWLVAATLTLGSLYSAYPMMQQDYIYNIWECSIYESLYRTAWSFGISWIIYACVIGYGGLVNTILSWPAWQPLSRVTYGLYLIHGTVIKFGVFSAKVPNYCSDLNVAVHFLGNLCIATFIAAVLALVLEYPVVAVEKYLLDKYYAGKQSKDDGGIIQYKSKEYSESET